MSPTLDHLVTIARRAGEMLRDGFSGQRQVKEKGAIDLVTEMDHQSEALLIQLIRHQFPTHRIVTEESGDLAGEVDHCWYLDPLDGTVNYAHGLPIYSVSVAYAFKGVMRLGVVYDPARDECYTGELGNGARLNGDRIRVSDTRTLNQSLLVTGFPYDLRTNPANNLDHFVRFTMGSQGVRRLGSAALDLCYVAMGRLDGYWEISVHSWDMAAGGLIVEEAGGVVTDRDGNADYLALVGSVVAANPHVHPQMVDILATK